jgi:glycosyltransferase involved in cell wall biosynthesis
VLISIVTPSLNQAPFLRDTLRSVAVQDYPNVEHIVMDGGSTDGSIEIIRDWASTHAIRWHAGPDLGQADAIQRGLADAGGSILTWLNSDDVYLDDHVLSDVAEAFERGASVVTGGGWYLAEDGARLRPIPVRPDQLHHGGLRRIDTVLQPATFFRRELFAVFPLDTELHYVFDWDLFIRMSAQTSFTPIERDIAGYRLHPAGKTLSGGVKRQHEILTVTRRYHGRHAVRSLLTSIVVALYRVAEWFPAPADRAGFRILRRLVWASHVLTKGHGIQS